MSAKDYLDNIGKWLERQTVSIETASGTQEYTLESYPMLTGGRVIESIARQSSATLDGITDNQSDIWAINISLVYRNEFTRVPL